MKPTSIKPRGLLLLPMLAAGCFSIAAPAHAHTGESGETRAYDPVDTAFGNYRPDLEPDREIDVHMSDDMRFNPEKINVEAGEVIRFTLVNEGELMHEFVLGTPTSLAEHAEMMKKFPGMEHDEPYMAHVEPGKIGAVIWQFSEAGEVAFGCLIEGHFDAGMKGVVDVDPQ